VTPNQPPCEPFSESPQDPIDEYQQRWVAYRATPWAIATGIGEIIRDSVVARGKARQGVRCPTGRMCGRRDEIGLMGH